VNQCAGAIRDEGLTGDELGLKGILGIKDFVGAQKKKGRYRKK